jgi:phenylalanyl-tRNA synthetase alpha chain
MRLPRRQAAVLEAASADDTTPIDRIATEADLAVETATGAAFDLEAAGLLAVEERTRVEHALTDEGERYRREGLPEVRLYRAAVAAGGDDDPVEMGTLLAEAEVDPDVAISNYVRKGYGTVEAGSVTADPEADPDADPEAGALAAVADGADADDDVLDRLVERNLLDRHERTERSVRLTDDGLTAVMEGVETGDAVSRLTPEMLTSGEWREVEFEPYDVEAAADPPAGGKVHVLRSMVERVKDVLVGMGFREMAGPHVDADFWINDCLFMPQDHPARTHWDRFALEVPAEVDELPEELVERVERAHREGVGPDGEGYHSPWEESFARALALRGHTTSLSMRYLSGEAGADVDPPARYFSVEKVYRNDTLDATHLLEFFQIEGWVLAEDLSVRDLMGTFEEFYAQFGITDLEYKPTYNPYTEPSFELFGTHPETGELIEVGNSGLFREEVLDPLGVEADVMAWGLSLERLLMLVYGFEDIRDVHGTLCDLDLLREAEVSY